MDLNKTPTEYRDELYKNAGNYSKNFHEEQVSDEKMVSGMGFVLSIIVALLFIVCVPLNIWIRIIVGIVIFSIGRSITEAYESYLFRNRYKIIDRKSSNLRQEIENKYQKYVTQYEKEVYARSIERENDEILKEICEFFMEKVEDEIKAANRDKTVSRVKVEWLFGISRWGIELEGGYPRKIYSFKERRVKDLPNNAEVEVLARAFVEQMKQRIEGVYKEDIVCHTPVSVEISRNSFSSAHHSRAEYSIVYFATNSNYVQRRDW